VCGYRAKRISLYVEKNAWKITKTKKSENAHQCTIKCITYLLQRVIIIACNCCTYRTYTKTNNNKQNKHTHTHTLQTQTAVAMPSRQRVFALILFDLARTFGSLRHKHMHECGYTFDRTFAANIMDS